MRARDDGASPDPDYVVKGKSATRVFYAPGSPYYARTRADVWFRTADDASAAGFTARAPRRSVSTYPQNTRRRQAVSNGTVSPYPRILR